MVHWLAPTLDLNLVVDLVDSINFFGFDDVNESLISGDLGSELQAAGLDVLVGDDRGIAFGDPRKPQQRRAVLGCLAVTGWAGDDVHEGPRLT